MTQLELFTDTEKKTEAETQTRAERHTAWRSEILRGQPPTARPAVTRPPVPLTLVFRGEPRAVQSFRFTRAGMRFQPAETVSWKNFIRLSAQSQLPPGFRMFEDAPLSLTAEFVFTAPKSMSKRDRLRIAAGETVRKFTRPDLTDNLMKGLCDALTGAVWRDDALISEVRSGKVYGAEPATRITVSPL
jgi:Holliday junction resolvase RusA-like endonuclease